MSYNVNRGDIFDKSFPNVALLSDGQSKSQMSKSNSSDNISSSVHFISSNSVVIEKNAINPDIKFEDAPFDSSTPRIVTKHAYRGPSNIKTAPTDFTKSLKEIHADRIAIYTNQTSLPKINHLDRKTVTSKSFSMLPNPPPNKVYNVEQNMESKKSSQSSAKIMVKLKKSNSPNDSLNNISYDSEKSSRKEFSLGSDANESKLSESRDASLSSSTHGLVNSSSTRNPEKHEFEKYTKELKKDCCVRYTDFKNNTDYVPTHFIQICNHLKYPSLTIERRSLECWNDDSVIHLTFMFANLIEKRLSTCKLQLCTKNDENDVVFVLFENESSCLSWFTVINAFTGNPVVSLIPPSPVESNKLKVAAEILKQRLKPMISQINISKDSIKTPSNNITGIGATLTTTSLESSSIPHCCTDMMVINSCWLFCHPSTRFPHTPLILELCFETLEVFHANAPGLYRLSGRKALIESVIYALNKPVTKVNLDDLRELFLNPKDLASFVKRVLSCLKPKIFSQDIIGAFLAGVKYSDGMDPVFGPALLTAQTSSQMFGASARLEVDQTHISQVLLELKHGTLLIEDAEVNNECQLSTQKHNATLQQLRYHLLQRISLHIALMSRFSNTVVQRLDCSGFAKMLAFNMHNSNDPVVTTKLNSLLSALASDYEMYFSDASGLPQGCEFYQGCPDRLEANDGPSGPTVEEVQVRVMSKVKESLENASKFFTYATGAGRQNDFIFYTGAIVSKQLSHHRFCKVPSPTLSSPFWMPNSPIENDAESFSDVYSKSAFTNFDDNQVLSDQTLRLCTLVSYLLDFMYSEKAKSEATFFQTLHRLDHLISSALSNSPKTYNQMKLSRTAISSEPDLNDIACSEISDTIDAANSHSEQFYTGTTGGFEDEESFINQLTDKIQQILREFNQDSEDFLTPLMEDCLNLFPPMNPYIK